MSTALDRLNQFRILWLFVYFDLPTHTKKDRKAASGFRKNLLKDGFNMIQFSVYARHCASRENTDVHKKRVKGFLPKLGNIIIFEITDKQFGMMEHFIGHDETSAPETPQQLELF